MFCLGCIISAVAECKIEGTKQTKIVNAFLRSIDRESLDVSNETASNIARGSKNPSGYFMEALGNLSIDSYKTIAEYFRNQIVVLIKENERNIVRDTLILMIQETQEIADNTIVDVVNGIEKSELTDEIDFANFLAGIFLYALNNTKNNIGGLAKKETKKYLTRVKNGEQPVNVKGNTLFTTESKILKQKSENSRADYPSREIELFKEQIEQEAISFCRKYKEEEEYIALCQIAFITNPIRVHHRKIYNEFCELKASTRNKVLEISEVDKINVSGKNWWYKYLHKFENDYKKYALGAERYLYSFDQYFPRLVEHGGEQIDRFTQHIFIPKVITPLMEAFSEDYKHDIAGLIDEYICYKDNKKYADVLEPPMDFMWRELSFSTCSELRLEACLALFIIGTCRGIPIPIDNEDKQFYFSGVGTPETAEDLFYQTLLTLYENYEICG